MELTIRASALFFKRSISKLWKPPLWNFNFTAQKLLQCPVPLQRNLYTHIRETGIAGFDKNRKILERERQGKGLPSWLENCRCVNQEEVENLYKAFPAFVQDLTTLSCTNNLPLGNDRLKDMTEHIVPWLPIQAVEVIATDRFYVERARRNNVKIVDEEDHKFLVHKLAWAVEMIARNGFVMDDLVDGSDKRNGLPGWHTLPNIGLQAVNDYGSLITGGLLVIERYFKTKDYYAELVKFIFEIMHVTVVSTNELHAMKSTQNHHTSYDYIDPSGAKPASSSSFKKMLVAKCALNSSIIIDLPVIATMIMHGIRDPVLINKAREIGWKVMESGSMVDDWTDCFGTIHVTERETSDIQNGSQSWLIWKAMELASPKQCQRLRECYGKNDAECVDEVKEIYRQLNIKEVVSKMAEDNAKDVEAEIAKLPQDDLPCSIWLNMLNHYRHVIAGRAARP